MTDLEHRLAENEQLVFVHIPKTAGLTFRGLLANHFDLRETYPNPDEWWHVIRDTKESLAGYRLFNGHYPYSVSEVLRNPVCVTMLRDPVDRLVSTYRYLLKNPNSFQYDVVAGRKMSLEEFLENPVTARAEMNWQAGFVGSIPLGELLEHQTRMADGSAWTGGDGPPFYPSLGVGVAIERLERFAMFGLCERFEASVFMLHYVFGWKPAMDYQSFNIAGGGVRRADLDSGLVERVLARNAEDVALHERATELFDERFRQMCEALLERCGDARHARMKFPLSPEVMVELLERHYERRYVEEHPEPRGAYVWDVAAAVDGSGWHAAEPVAKERFGRWTGPGRTTSLDVRLAPGTDYVLEFEIAYAPAPAQLRGLELRANGERLPMRRTGRFSWRRRRFRATIPRAVVERRSGNLVTLEWTVPRTVSARELDPAGTDARIVGVMFGGLQIAPIRTRAAEAGSREPA